MPLRLWLAAALLLSMPGPAPAWTLHVAAAYDVAEAPTFPRALSRGLGTVNREILRSLNFSLSVLPLPLGNADNRTRATVDQAMHELCASLETRRILVLLVVGSRPAAVAVALAAGSAGLPVLWARNDSTAPFFQQSLSKFEVHMDPSMDELIAAVRALLLAAHWHTFSIVSDDTADATAVRSSLSSGGAPLSPPAMSPVIRVDAKPETVFHRLAELQRATRGVVLLAARPAVARLVLIEAGRLQMLSSDWVWLVLDTNELVASLPRELLPVGLLSLKPRTLAMYTKQTLKSVIRVLAKVMRTAITKNWLGLGDIVRPTCWRRDYAQLLFAKRLSKALRSEVKGALSGSTRDPDLASLAAKFELRNLVPPRVPLFPPRPPVLLLPQSVTGTSPTKSPQQQAKPGDPVWRTVGNVTGTKVTLDTIVWPGGEIVGPAPGGRSVFRVVTALAPPFVMEGLLEDGQCLRGLRCHRIPRSAGANRDNMTLLFSWEPEDDVTEDRPLRPTCCYGFAMDLLENIAQELEFDFHLYLVSDGLYGAKKWNHKFREFEWNGIMGDLVSGAAHMSFSGLSVSSQRSEAVDFTAPFYFGGVSLLAAPTQVNEIPLLAFLLPFSPELWIAIFVSLNMTAIAVAIYEWLSPFGLNPWGRQRSKNFSMASALWVMWGLLCGHLVAFKAPKSWPNKFLINVWGGFSVIFVASYTANIAALIAGHFFQNSPSYHDRSLLSQRVGAARSTVAEFYVQQSNQALWQHMQQYSLRSIEEGVARLRNGTLDMLIGDTSVLDYYRATDPGCTLQRFGDPISQDMYAVAMSKGFPLKDSISAVISKYSNNGYLDILQEKWYGGLPCFRLETEMVQPRPLGVAAVAGVFLLLGLGFLVGLIILVVEHVFYRRCLPGLRSKPKGTVWRSRNVMFFSQKLYRFINCVELVSPHHAARELMHTLRQGHITSLFQKSVKRKEHEQRRRRKSKAQFFEMIQEIRRYTDLPPRVQAEERDQVVTTTSTVTSPTSDEQNDVRPRLLEETGRRIARHQEDAPPTICRKRSSSRADSTNDLPTVPRHPEDRDVSLKRSSHVSNEVSSLPRHPDNLSRRHVDPANQIASLPRHPEDLCLTRSGRQAVTNEASILPRHPEDVCLKRSERKPVTNEASTLPRHPEDLCLKRSGRQAVTNEASTLPRHPEDLCLKRSEKQTMTNETSTLPRHLGEQTVATILHRKRNTGRTPSNQRSVISTPQPPPSPPPLPPPEPSTPPVIIANKEEQWRKREGLLKQQLSEALREKQVLLDRIKVLERCIKEPP